MVSEYTPNRDGVIDDAPFSLAGVVSFDDDGVWDDPDDDDGEGVVAAADGNGGDVAGVREEEGG